MSKPLATKVSTPLSENVQIGPKVSIFCVATIIFQHCLNLLGHGIHHSFTGFHWSPLPLLHDDITEPVYVRELALLHLLRMPHRLPLPSAFLARQWSSWRCVWGCYHGMLPCGPVSKGRESSSASVCHSICWHSWFPQWIVAPQCRQHSCSPRSWHSHHHAWHTCLCTSHLVAATHAWHHLN